MPTEATFKGASHPWLAPDTDGMLYDHRDDEVTPRPKKGELWFLPEHRERFLYSVTEEEVERWTS
jgi:hypothetical protein